VESPLLTIKETAVYLKVHFHTVYDLVRTKELPALKIGRAYRIPKEKLDEWISDQMKDNSNYPVILHNNVNLRPAAWMTKKKRR
jgi:excisionase family DNA binding protein